MHHAWCSSGCLETQEKGLVDKKKMKKKTKKHLHRSAKRGHGVTDLVDVFLLSVNAQSHLFNKR
jgi:hypothetical protein